jgi:hypothetical protein
MTETREAISDRQFQGIRRPFEWPRLRSPWAPYWL